MIFDILCECWWKKIAFRKKRYWICIDSKIIFAQWSFTRVGEFLKKSSLIIKSLRNISIEKNWPLKIISCIKALSYEMDISRDISIKFLSLWNSILSMKWKFFCYDMENDSFPLPYFFSWNFLFSKSVLF